MILGRADKQDTPGAFAFYPLNLSWLPEFCTTHAGGLEYGRGLEFFVHGLWPQDVTGDYPEARGATPRPATLQKYADIIPTASLIQHE